MAVNFYAKPSTSFEMRDKTCIMTYSLLSFGHGYSAQALALLLQQPAWRITGTTQTEAKAADLRQSGTKIVQWPGENLSAALAEATHILVSIGPNAEGDPVFRAFGAQIASLAPQLKWLGYLSTTGVYGDHQGGWVDETTLLAPSTKRGQWRCQAESAWQTLANSANLPLHIFRLAGIYGPGRGPFAKLRAGTARRIVKPGQVFSRIHVDDIAQVLAASMANPKPGAIYNLCDDDPAAPQDVLAFAAELLGLSVPPAEDFATAEMTPMARSFYAESKMVRNDKIKSELGITLHYPTYAAGLQALLKAG